MALTRHWLAGILAALFCCLLHAQSTSQQSPIVSRLVSFSSVMADEHGKAISGIAGTMFAIYEDQSGASALWFEGQNVQFDINSFSRGKR